MWPPRALCRPQGHIEASRRGLLWAEPLVALLLVKMSRAALLVSATPPLGESNRFVEAEVRAWAPERQHMPKRAWTMLVSATPPLGESNRFVEAEVRAWAPERQHKPKRATSSKREFTGKVFISTPRTPRNEVAGFIVSRSSRKVKSSQVHPPHTHRSRLKIHVTRGRAMVEPREKMCSFYDAPNA